MQARRISNSYEMQVTIDRARRAFATRPRDFYNTTSDKKHPGGGSRSFILSLASTSVVCFCPPAICSRTSIVTLTTDLPGSLAWRRRRARYWRQRPKQKMSLSKYRQPRQEHVSAVVKGYADRQCARFGPVQQLQRPFYLLQRDLRSAASRPSRFEEDVGAGRDAAMT